MGLDLARIGHQIGLGEDHAARAAETAGGEKDDADIGRFGFFGKQPRQFRGHDGEQLVRGRDFLADIIEIDDAHISLHALDQVFELGVFDKPARGQDSPDLSSLRGRLHIGLAGGEVDHHRHHAKGMQGKEGNSAPCGGWHHHADTVFLAEITLEQA